MDSKRSGIQIPLLLCCAQSLHASRKCPCPSCPCPAFFCPQEPRAMAKESRQRNGNGKRLTWKNNGFYSFLKSQIANRKSQIANIANRKSEIIEIPPNNPAKGRFQG